MGFSDEAGSKATKADIRRQIRRLRSDRAAQATPGSTERELCAAQMAAHIVDLARLHRATTVALYCSMPTEPPTGVARRVLRAAGIQVLLPHMLPDKDLDWFDDIDANPQDCINFETPPSTTLGCDAIASAQVIFVPALACDKYGHRLGQGGGSYDRALARVRPGTPIYALLFDDEILPVLPHEAHDQPIVGAITPQGRVALSTL